MHFASAFRLLCFALRGKHYRQPLLARERLRYVAEPIAAVFATDPYLAEGAAELVSNFADQRPLLVGAVPLPAHCGGLCGSGVGSKAERG